MGSPVHVALVFHCNQAISPFAQIAAENCYRGLVRVLRRHPRAHLNFHWSGTLLACLRWWYPDLVEEIREEVNAGRWELLASTYGQHVPFSAPRNLNAIATAGHLAALRATVPEANPRGFWLAERCWKNEIADQILDAGLEWTLIEDHMLAASGCRDLHRPRRIETPTGRELTVCTDHERFKHAVNCAVWTGHVEPVLEHLRAVQREAGEGASPPLVTYAEDGEASGLWGAERGCPPQILWEHLDRLLTALEREPWIRLTRISDHLDAHRESIAGERRALRRGQAKWMVASLADEHLPYHEDGYRDWFDFNERAEKLVRLRPALRRVSAEIRSCPTRSARQRRLGLQAALAMCAHVYEFGCIGIGGSDGKPFERHRAALLPLRLARGEVPNGSRRVDLNADGETDHVLVTRDLLSIWSPRSGALLSLFDRPTGDEMVGNELAAVHIFGQGFRADVIPEPRPVGTRWSGFRSGRQRLEDFDDLWREVPRGRAWMRWVLDWDALPTAPRRIRQVTVDRDNPWVLENGTRAQSSFEWPPRVRPGALVERLEEGGKVMFDGAERSRSRRRELPVESKGNRLTLTLCERDVAFLKTVRQRGSLIEVVHTITNHSRRRRDLTLTVESEWVPSYLTLALFGRDALEITPDGARNRLTGAAVEFTIQADAGVTAERETEWTLLGLLDRRRIALSLDPGKAATLNGTLRITRARNFAHLDSITEEWPTWCGK